MIFLRLVGDKYKKAESCSRIRYLYPDAFYITGLKVMRLMT